MSKTAVIWPYRFGNFRGTAWEPRMQDICRVLQERGYIIRIGTQDKKLMDIDIPGAEPYDCEAMPPVDIAIYNHATRAEIKGNIVPASRTWFYKPCGPTPEHVTLDRLGYGAYSEAAYARPRLTGIRKRDVKAWFTGPVQEWIGGNVCKWGNTFKPTPVWDNDYEMIIGQVPGDYTVRAMWFGDYIAALVSIVQELARVSPRKIVLKLHPYMDGKEKGKPTPHKDRLMKLIGGLVASNRVALYDGMCSAHPFYERAHSVWACNSGAGIEALLHHKPVVTWGHAEYHHAGYDLRHLVDSECALTLDWHDRAASDKWIYWYLTRHCVYDATSAARRVAELLEAT